MRTDGTVACWGRNSSWQASPPGNTFTQTSAGLYHTCGVRTDGTVACWGNSSFDQTLMVIADFTATPRSGNLPLYVSFADNSFTAPDSWSWIFGDGGSSSQMHPGHTYRTPGSYMVGLVVTNAAGSNLKAVADYITVSSCPLLPVKRGTNYDRRIQSAYDPVVGPAEIAIQAQAMIFPENLNFDTPNVTVTLLGGYPCDYDSFLRIPDTVVDGRVTISAGTLIVDRLVIE